MVTPSPCIATVTEAASLASPRWTTPVSNPNKEKGTRWERAVETHFRAEGFPEVTRIRGRGAKDEGDLGGLRSFAIECKDHARPAWHDFVRQANEEARNAGKPFGVAVVKKRQAKTEEALVVMDLATFTRLLQHIERLGGRV